MIIIKVRLVKIIYFYLQNLNVRIWLHWKEWLIWKGQTAFLKCQQPFFTIKFHPNYCLIWLIQLKWHYLS